MNSREHRIFQGSSFEDLQRVSLPPKESVTEQARSGLRRTPGGPERDVWARLGSSSTVPLQIASAGLSACTVRPFDPALLQAVDEVFHRDLGGLSLRVGRIRVSPEFAALTTGDTLYLDEQAVHDGPLAVSLLVGRALAHHWQQQDGRAGAPPLGGLTTLLRDPVLEQEADIYAWLLAARAVPAFAKSRPLPSATADQRQIAPEITITAPEDVPPVPRRVVDGKRVRWLLEAPAELTRGLSSRTKAALKSLVHGKAKSGSTGIARAPAHGHAPTGRSSTGAITSARPGARQIPQFAVSQITFGGNIPIEYARIPNQTQNAPNDTYIRTGQYAPRQHIDPVLVLPAGVNPHWTAATQNGREVSWPAAYVQGAGGATVTANFTATRNFTGVKWIQATSTTGVQTHAIQVNFANGVANGIAFPLTIPAGGVRRLSGFQLNWRIGDANPPTQAIGASMHTLFVLHAAPLAARGEQLFEIFDWACGWADQAAGAAAVVTAIWNRFAPVQNAHPTGLVYWKNHQSQAPLAQDLPAAIRSRDTLAGGRRGASCIVFDRVFINCLAIHGIQAAEVMLTPAQYTVNVPGIGPMHGFMIGGWWYRNPTGWQATTVVAHGNAQAPDSWQSHWICAVNHGGVWTLYDPSYGVTVAWPGFGLPIGVAAVAIPAAYEVAAVANFPCILEGYDVPINLPSANPNPPHLVGAVLWHN